MKNTTFTIIIAITLLALTACGGSNPPDAQQFNPSSNNDDIANAELSLASKLVIGSFKLEDTGNAITPEQAAELIPLWQVFTQLSTSDTAAQEEITALAEQIQETMTQEQITAIDTMNLTQQDVFTTMQEQGIQFGGAGQQGQNNFQPDGNGFTPPEGGFGGGGGPGSGPGGGGGPGGGFGSQNISPEQIATAQAARAENGGGGFRFNNTPAPLIEALIKLLEERAG